MSTKILRFDGSVERSPEVDRWLNDRPEARQWFEVMRNCGDEVRELIHDGCPVACFGDAPFGYVNVFKSHMNVGFFQGAALPDPSRLLEGGGKQMRHVKIRAKAPINASALMTLIESAYSDIKARVEAGL